MQKLVSLRDLGLIDYQEAWSIQEKFFNSIIKEKLNRNNSPIEYNLLFCEHPHVYTLGKSGVENNLLLNNIQLQAKNASFYKVNRGGDITYHGPGQIVGYPIIDLEPFKIGIKAYVDLLEESIINTIAHLGIKGERLKGASGVWLDTDSPAKVRKICAMGVRASRYVTMHGFALNVNTDLNYFGYINPCGFTDKSVTSLQSELGRKINISEVKQILLKELTALFKWTII